MERDTAKRKPKISHLKPLMDATFSGRHHWVKTKMPPVSTIMERFLALKIPRLVRHWDGEGVDLITASCVSVSDEVRLVKHFGSGG